MSKATHQNKRETPLHRQEIDLYRYPGHLIRRMHQAGVALFDAHITQSGHDLTPVQFSALTIIQAFPGLDQAGLASAIGYDRATTGGVVDRLEQKGFLKRDISETDRRSRVLSLLPEGEKLLQEVTPIVERFESSLLRGLTDAESETFLRLLQKSLAAVNDVSRSPLRMVTTASNSPPENKK